jgi:hypothetical protein
MSDLITCTRCDQDKPEDAFAYCFARGLQRWCRQCKTDHQRERRRQLRTEQPFSNN